ncbi:MAG: hypothetical protein IKN95_11360 [Lachnospiraceae bacterium]|nr:hypothetical protein [Lachnospiraceae bacterium]
MASIQELVNTAHSIKTTSNELSNMTAAASQSLKQKAAEIGMLVRGSVSGQEAVMAVNIASKSLADAAVSMNALSRICDNTITSLSS